MHSRDELILYKRRGVLQTNQVTLLTHFNSCSQNYKLKLLNDLKLTMKPTVA